MTTHKIGTREELQAACAALLEREKEHTRMGDELARQRRSLPWVPVDKEYALQTADGPKTLAQLFDGRSQLLIYHFMFGPSYEAGCPVNSSIADTFDSLIPHLKARDVTLIAVSGAPIEKLLAYRERMGWKFGWASSYESDFSLDIGFSSSLAAAQTYSIGSYGKDGSAESTPVGGPTTNYDCDIIYSNGAFIQYAEGVQQ